MSDLAPRNHRDTKRTEKGRAREDACTQNTDRDLSCIDDLSTNSLFSSPADSLSEYADAQSFISTDNLDTAQRTQSPPEEEEEAEEEDSEELGHVDTYA
ncbi:unnamed protein product [Lampetra planeri]